MIREGGDMGHGLNQLHKVQPSDFCTSENTQCVCNVHFGAVGRYDEREGGEGRVG